MSMMSGVQLQSDAAASSALKQGSATATTTTTTCEVSKPKKKICCACPDTKRLRDECIVEHGEDACAKWIEAHRLCLRAEGFNVWLIQKIGNNPQNITKQNKQDIQWNRIDWLLCWIYTDFGHSFIFIMMVFCNFQWNTEEIDCWARRWSSEYFFTP